MIPGFQIPNSKFQVSSSKQGLTSVSARFQVSRSMFGIVSSLLINIVYDKTDCKMSWLHHDYLVS